MTVYPHLFSPLEIGGVSVRNRIMQTAHVKLWAHNSVDSERNVAYQAARAKGGAGLLITGNRVVHPTSTTGFPRVAWAYRPEALESDRRLTSAVHEHGALIFAQLNHFGLNATSDSADDFRVLWGPSAVKSPAYGETPKAMEHEDIREVVEWWGRSAELTREGGFDGTEVHISHSYLLHQFLSPLYNKREDEYGGSFENRLRFARQVIEEVRARAGNDWIVGVRISLTDFIPGALDIEDAIRAVRLLEADGQIDYVNVTAAGYHNIYRAIEPADVPDGYLVDLTAQVKAALPELPVFTVGGIKDPAMAEEILATGKADMVAMTRAQIADPEFANKVREGRESELVHCIRGTQAASVACSRGCRSRAPSIRVPGANGDSARERCPRPISRRAGSSPAAGRQDEGRRCPCGARPPGDTPRARGRARGQVNLILRTPGRDEFGWITRDLEGQLHRHGVDVRLGTEATTELVRELAPDAVIVASGAVPSRTGFSSVNPLAERLPGAGQDNVLTVWDVLLETLPIGRRVIVLDDDGTRYAAGVTEVLLDRGCDVEPRQPLANALSDDADHPGHGTPLQPPARERLRYRLNEWAASVEGNRVALFNLYTGAQDTIDDVDTVVLATGPAANDELYFTLEGQLPNIRRIGDCVAPRKLDHAIYEGELAGREPLVAGGALHLRGRARAHGSGRPRSTHSPRFRIAHAGPETRSPTPRRGSHGGPGCGRRSDTPTSFSRHGRARARVTGRGRPEWTTSAVGKATVQRLGARPVWPRWPSGRSSRARRGNGLPRGRRRVAPRQGAPGARFRPAAARGSRARAPLHRPGRCHAR